MWEKMIRKGKVRSKGFVQGFAELARTSEVEIAGFLWENAVKWGILEAPARARGLKGCSSTAHAGSW